MRARGSLDASVIAQLMDEVGGLELPAVRFFRPTPTFFTAMEAFRCLTIYDVGAGVGHVAASLAARAFDVVAFDLNDRDERACKVRRGNGATFPYETGSVVMLCRPCHGPFASLVAERAEVRGAAWFLYVGLPRNRTRDLGARKFRSITPGVGLDGERLYARRLR